MFPVAIVFVPLASLYQVKFPVLPEAVTVATLPQFILRLLAVGGVRLELTFTVTGTNVDSQFGDTKAPT